MKTRLFLLLCLLLPLQPLQAKPDMGQILSGIAEVGARAAQQPGNIAGNALQGVQQQFNDIKDSYKEEGRAYARELGDIMMDKAMANKKVNRTLDSVRALCWGVVVYITLISILLFGMMLRISGLLKQLKALADEQAHNKE